MAYLPTNQVGPGVGRLLPYLQSSEHYDIRIELQDDVYYCHKVILSAGSDYFKACFQSGFKETTDATMFLDEEKYTMAMGFMFQYLYGCTLVNEDPEKAAEECRKDAGNPAAVKLIAETYAVAQKYLVPGLCEQAKHVFACILEHTIDLPDGVSILLELVEHIYGPLAEGSVELRDVLVFHFARHMGDLSEDERFRAVMMEHPEFAADLTTAFLKKRAEKGSSKDGGKKRKAHDAVDLQ